MVSLSEEIGVKVAEEVWEAVKKILRKYNCETGPESKALGIALVTFKADEHIHVSTHGLLCPKTAVAALIETFDIEAAKHIKGVEIPVG